MCAHPQPLRKTLAQGYERITRIPFPHPYAGGFQCGQQTLTSFVLGALSVLQWGNVLQVHPHQSGPRTHTVE